jgi:drug/metabolite transporter (DMT)-like permease
MHPALIAPLVSAFLYAFAAMALKRATEKGGGPWRIGFVTNCVQAVIFAPVWLLGGEAFTWANLAHAGIVGALFFVGQIFTFLALSRGDVSVVTPVLGTKVVLVAGFTVLILRQGIPTAWWWAAGLTVVATVLLGGNSAVKTSELTFKRSLVYGFTAATMYALTDVLAQQWSKQWGFGHFAPVMFLVVALLSFLFIPFFTGPLSALPAVTWKWLIGGAVLLSAQAMGIAFAIMTYGEATLVNILYTSRGIWTIAIVWMFGHWFGNMESTHGTKVMLRRLLGSGLILVAVKLAVKG